MREREEVIKILFAACTNWKIYFVDSRDAILRFLFFVAFCNVNLPHMCLSSTRERERYN